MARKRTALDREISRVQKNTRNKLYRLRKQKGVVNTEELDPRRDTSGMSGSQKIAYLKTLSDFNSRDNSFHVQSNGVAIPHTRFTRFMEKLETQAKRSVQRLSDIESAYRETLSKRQRSIANRAKRMENAKGDLLSLNKIQEDVAELSKMVGAVGRVIDERNAYDQRRNMAMRWNAATGDFELPQNVRYADLEPVIRALPFESLSEFEREERRWKAFRDDDQREKAARNWQAYGAERLRDAGYGEFAEMLEELDMEQLDWMHYYTQFDDWLSRVWYEDKKGNYRKMTKLPDETNQEYLGNLVDIIYVASGRFAK